MNKFLRLMTSLMIFFSAFEVIKYSAKSSPSNKLQEHLSDITLYTINPEINAVIHLIIK